MAPGDEGLNPMWKYVKASPYGATSPTARLMAAPMRSPFKEKGEGGFMKRSWDYLHAAASCSSAIKLPPAMRSRSSSRRKGIFHNSSRVCG